MCEVVALLGKCGCGASTTNEVPLGDARNKYIQIFPDCSRKTSIAPKMESSLRRQQRDPLAQLSSLEVASSFHIPS